MIHNQANEYNTPGCLSFTYPIIDFLFVKNLAKDKCK